MYVSNISFKAYALCKHSFPVKIRIAHKDVNMFSETVKICYNVSFLFAMVTIRLLFFGLCSNRTKGRHRKQQHLKSVSRNVVLKGTLWSLQTLLHLEAHNNVLIRFAFFKHLLKPSHNPFCINQNYAFVWLLEATGGQSSSWIKRLFSNLV